MNTSAYDPPHEFGTTSLNVLQGAAQDEADNWRGLVLLFGPVVRYWMRHRGINESDEADVFQNVFAHVLRQLPRLELAEGAAKFRVWIKTVAVTRIAEFHCRRPELRSSAAAWQQLQELPAEFSFAAEAVLSQQGDKPPTRQVLQILREEFSAQHWQAFWRTAIDGCPASAVADELSLSPLAVCQARSQVLEKLREYLNGLGES